VIESVFTKVESTVDVVSTVAPPHEVSAIAVARVKIVVFISINI
jgi:hypothetical protein